MHKEIHVLGYSENNNTVAFDLVAYNKKKKLSLGFGIHNFISVKTKIAINKSIPNCEQLALDALSTNDMHLDVKIVRDTSSYKLLKNKYLLCKF